MGWPDTTRRSDNGILQIGGVLTTDLAQEFGTPLYIFDETTLRNRARSIRTNFHQAYENSRIVYAGKAYLSPALMRMLVEEGIGLDVVSGGELYAGLLAGVAPADIVFHGNNKSRSELHEAVTAGVGIIAVDNDLEISLLDEISRSLNQAVDVMLRLNPGVDPHTHQKMRTGAHDSKFGFPVADGQAERAVAAVCAASRLRLIGYHAHVGSQIFDPHLVDATIAVLMQFAALAASRHGVIPEVVSPGGGFGLSDDASGGDVSVETWASVAANALQRECRRYGFAPPMMIVEPGRAIVAPAGVALYVVGARKVISESRTYVSVDGGMADNIRPTLYGAKYAASIANRDGSGEPLEQVTIAGKYCESGDILIENLTTPTLRTGDLLAMPMVGAYCLAMASNYNLAPRPPVVSVKDGHSRLLRRRETYQDMLRTEIELDPALDSPGTVGLSDRKGSL